MFLFSHFLLLQLGLGFATNLQHGRYSLIHSNTLWCLYIIALFSNKATGWLNEIHSTSGRRFTYQMFGQVIFVFYSLPPHPLCLRSVVVVKLIIVFFYKDMAYLNPALKHWYRIGCFPSGALVANEVIHVLSFSITLGRRKCFYMAALSRITPLLTQGTEQSHAMQLYGENCSLGHGVW